MVKIKWWEAFTIFVGLPDSDIAFPESEYADDIRPLEFLKTILSSDRYLICLEYADNFLVRHGVSHDWVKVFCAVMAINKVYPNVSPSSISGRFTPYHHHKLLCLLNQALNMNTVAGCLDWFPAYEPRYVVYAIKWFNSSFEYGGKNTQIKKS